MNCVILAFRMVRLQLGESKRCAPFGFFGFPWKLFKQGMSLAIVVLSLSFSRTLPALSVPLQRDWRYYFMRHPLLHGRLQRQASYAIPPCKACLWIAIGSFYGRNWGV